MHTWCSTCYPRGWIVTGCDGKGYYNGRYPDLPGYNDDSSGSNGYYNVGNLDPASPWYRYGGRAGWRMNTSPNVGGTCGTYNQAILETKHPEVGAAARLDALGAGITNTTVAAAVLLAAGAGSAAAAAAAARAALRRAGAPASSAKAVGGAAKKESLVMVTGSLKANKI